MLLTNDAPERSLYFPNCKMQDDSGGVDFQQAAIYVVGVQAVVGVVTASSVSVLSCWLLPVQAVSAVRTLTLSSIASLACVYKPVRLARVAGLNVVFNSLRPAIPLYLVRTVHSNPHIPVTIGTS